MTTFAKRITAARKGKKLTQEQVAQAVGVSRQTVSHWENGRVEPTQEQREAAMRQGYARLKADSGRRCAGCVRHDSGDGGVSDL